MNKRQKYLHSWSFYVSGKRWIISSLNGSSEVRLDERKFMLHVPGLGSISATVFSLHTPIPSSLSLVAKERDCLADTRPAVSFFLCSEF